MPERLEMIGDRNAVEAEALGGDAEREQVGGRELLGGRLVAEAQWGRCGGKRHRLGPMVAPSHGGWLALVPVKALPRAKSRLAGVLDGDARADLMLSLMQRVVGACQEAGLEVCVVSPDPEVHAAARALGAEALDDGGRDLTGSVELALERHANAPGVAVLASDLPDVTAADVQELIAQARPLAIAEAADGTTNAIAACPPDPLHKCRLRPFMNDHHIGVGDCGFMIEIIFVDLRS